MSPCHGGLSVVFTSLSITLCPGVWIPRGPFPWALTFLPTSRECLWLKSKMACFPSTYIFINFKSNAALHSREVVRDFWNIYTQMRCSFKAPVPVCCIPTLGHAQTLIQVSQEMTTERETPVAWRHHSCPTLWWSQQRSSMHRSRVVWCCCEQTRVGPCITVQHMQLCTAHRACWR